MNKGEEFTREVQFYVVVTFNLLMGILIGWLIWG